MTSAKTWNRAVLAVAAAVCATAGVGHAGAAVYAGNGGLGFGGPVGTGALTVTDDGAGNVTFTFNGGATHPTLDGNDLVVYLSTGAAGLADTSTLVDNGDGGREAISGYNAANNTRTQVDFPTGFAADYAVSIEDASVNLFQLPLPGTVNYLTYIAPTSSGTSPDTITFPLADIGLTQGQSFSLVGTDDAEAAYRSDEAIGTTTPSYAGSTTNIGATGTLAFTAADTYATTAVPEPAGLGVLAIGGALAFRRRRAVAGR